MFQKNNNLYRQPKVFQAPHDKKKKVWPKVILISLLVLIVFIVLIYLIFFSKFFVIKNVEIIGSPTQNIRDRLDQFKGQNLFSFKIRDVEKAFVEENQNLIGVKMYRGIPDTIRIKFEDRDPKIIWESANKKYLVDEKAILYKEIDESSLSSFADLPLVKDSNNLSTKIPSQISSEQFINFIRAAKTDFNSQKIEIEYFEIKETTFQMTAVTKQGLKIYLNSLRPLSDQTEAFRKVYDQFKNEIKEYIDLRVEGKVYFR